MKNKELIKIAFAFALIMCLFPNIISSVSAISWKQYGNDFSPLSQSANPTEKGLISQNYVITKNQGYTVGTPSLFTDYQPLVFDFNDSLSSPLNLQQYIVFPNNNYIQVYDRNLNLVNEVFSDVSISQIAITDFEQDGTTNDIVGVFKNNDTEYSFKSFSYNVSTQTFIQKQQQNISVISGSYVAGLRCQGADCYFLTSLAPNNATFFYVNKTSKIEIPLNANKSYTEPLAFFDINGDGTLEFMTYSTNELLVFDKQGNIELKQAITNLLSSRLYQPDNSAVWKIATLSQTSGNAVITVYKPDGSVYYTTSFSITGTISCSSYSGYLAIGDYDLDGFSDLFMDLYCSQASSTTQYVILKGDTGVNIGGMGYSGGAGTVRSLTIADMDGDGKLEFIGVSNYLEVVRGNNTRAYQSAISFNDGYRCIPADMDLNGKLDIVCSSAGKSSIVYSNYTNQLPTISQVSYDPSTFVTLGQNLNAIISANDIESDSIIYASKCFSADTWHESTSSTQTCVYATAGLYTMTVGVRDQYHSEYTEFPQTITVSESGSICNNNNVCESNLGETNSNCPNDCTVTSGNVQSQDGMSLPTEIVSTTNPNQGILPELYMGSLAFFSGTLKPMIFIGFALLFCFGLVAIIITVKKLVSKL